MVVDSIVSNSEVSNLELSFYIGESTNYKDKIIEVIREHSDIDWLRAQNGSWNENFKVEFAEILTTRGFGFSFNIMDFDEIFRESQ